MQTITRSSEVYPRLFRGIANEPTKLYTRGDTSLLNTPCVAIIGTREPTPAGIHTTRQITKWCVSQGYTIVAGLCPGIDTVAHETALNELGHTIAVLASTLRGDIHKVHKGNGMLSSDIVNNGGLLITEYDEPAYAPRRYFERDRLQSALSLVVIPVQAGESSGTLHTCSHAINQERSIWLPAPTQSDFETNREKYEGLVTLFLSGKARWFTKDSYPELAEYIASQHK